MSQKETIEIHHIDPEMAKKGETMNIDADAFDPDKHQKVSAKTAKPSEKSTPKPSASNAKASVKKTAKPSTKKTG